MNMYIAVNVARNLILRTNDKLKNNVLYPKYKQVLPSKCSNETINVIKYHFITKYLELQHAQWVKGEQEIVLYSPNKISGRIDQRILYRPRNTLMC